MILGCIVRERSCRLQAIRMKERALQLAWLFLKTRNSPNTTAQCKLSKAFMSSFGVFAPSRRVTVDKDSLPVLNELRVLLAPFPPSSLEPKVISFNSAISACEVCGCWQAALKLLDVMPRAKLTPTAVTCSSAIKCLRQRRAMEG